MFFTQEDYIKIQQWLIKNSVKDTEFNEANIPFNGEEIITIVQGNQNKKVFLKDLIAQVFNLGISDFVNITDKYDAPNISIEEAIRLIPSRARKEGQVITFLDRENHWHIYQFKGALNQWNVLDTWEDLFDWEKLIIDSILPDEEDLTKSSADENGNSYLSLKDREYNPKDFSGLGRVILRKNIVEVEDPIYGKVKKNSLYQDMINKENTIYEIRYDFDLNGQEITIPEGCVLDFQGGSFSNGSIVGNMTKLSNSFHIFNNITISGTWNVPFISTDIFIDASTNVYILDNLVSLSHEYVYNTIEIRQGDYNVNFKWSDKYFYYGCRIKSNTNLIINGNINVIPNSFKAYEVFLIEGVNNVHIQGFGCIIGDKDSHDYIEDGGTHEWGHGIAIYSSEYIVIEGVKIKNFTGDGIYVGGIDNTSNNISICNFEIETCRRQGISIINARNVYINNGKVVGIEGVSPQAAFDLEPNEGSIVEDIFIKNVVIRSCFTGISIYGYYNIVKNINIENVNIYNPAIAGNIVNYIYKGHDIFFKNIGFFDEQNREKVIPIYQISNSKNVSIKENNIKTESKYMIIQSENENNSNIEVENNNIIAPNSYLFGNYYNVIYKNNSIAIKKLRYYATSFEQDFKLIGNIIKVSTMPSINAIGSFICMDNTFSSDDGTALVLTIRNESEIKGNHFKDGIEITNLSNLNFTNNIVDKKQAINGSNILIIDNIFKGSYFYLSISNGSIHKNTINVSEKNTYIMEMRNCVFTTNDVRVDDIIVLKSKNSVGGNLIAFNSFSNTVTKTYSVSIESPDNLFEGNIIKCDSEYGLYINGSYNKFLNNIFKGTFSKGRYVLSGGITGNSFDNYGAKGGATSEMFDFNAHPQINDISQKGSTFYDTSYGKPVWWDGYNWRNADGSIHNRKMKGESSNRPSSDVKTGAIYFDETLNKPIWWTGSKWVDATGADV